jgi:hypothetical protein
MDWQALEKMVRRIAEIKFSCPARAQDIGGVRCDCVLDLGNGSVVIIEISKEGTINKLRVDITKFNTIRPFFFHQNIFPRCIFITLEEPTPSLIASGKASFVEVYSVVQFFNAMLGVGDYTALRTDAPFGSAIDLYSGKPDTSKFVPVEYVADSGEAYSTAQIAAQLIKGRTIVLIGDYGTGKSRCVKEVFAALVTDHATSYMQPIAINLRDNWGLKRASEVITRHFTDLGLADHVDDILKVAYSAATVYLLDGFDEIGAQTWSDDPTRLVDIRRQSLVGIKDLIDRSQGGILITGREHYFNNDAELLTCLGLDKKQVIIIRCNQELSDSEFSEMMGGTPMPLPKWVPKKPLIGVIIRDLDPDAVRHIFSTSTGQIDFWDLLLDTFCEREAKINALLDASIIRSLYSQIGRLSRTTKGSLGPISIKDINDAFERTTGRPPTDESAIILQRLPGLSRIGAESLDRQFIDTYILDGLKAEDVLQIYSEEPEDVLKEEWKHPIEEFGMFFVATRIQSIGRAAALKAYVKRHSLAKNRVLLSDMLTALFLCEGIQSEFAGLVFSGGRFTRLALSDSPVTNIRFQDCLFEYLDLTDAQPKGITIADSTIIRADGVTSIAHLPPWVTNCLVEEFQSVNTLAQIRIADLTVAQTFLLSSLRKLFLQPGGGRRHSSMYKGYGDAATKKICEKVIAMLVRGGFCERIQGTTEDLYIPDRSLTARAKLMTNQMTQSHDPMWLQVSKLQ